MDIRSEFEKAYLEYVKNNSMDNTWETCFEAGAKWMGERLEKEFNPDPALTGKKSNVSERIRQLIKDLDNHER